MSSPASRCASVVVAVGLGLAVAACGSSSDVGAGDPGATTTVAAGSAPEATSGPAATAGPPASAVPPASASILPSVPLTDVRSGATVDLASLVPAQRPLLLWFWAPH